MEDIKKYSYKPKLKRMILVCLFFFGCTVILTHGALTNNRGAEVYHVIPLSVEQAKIFYWCLALLSFTFVLLGCWGILKSISSHDYIELSVTELKIPKAHLLGKAMSIALKDISDVTIEEVYGYSIARFYFNSGKASISHSFFESKVAFDDFMQTLVQRVSMVRADGETHH